jgi:hypothetical protein
MGRRGSFMSQLIYLAYAAKGKAAKFVRLALVFCADLTISAPIGSQSGASLSRRSLSSPRGLLYYNLSMFIMLYSEQLFIACRVNHVNLCNIPDLKKMIE